MPSHPVVSLIGYEGRKADEFLRILRDAGVTLLVDVRRYAFSHKRGFSKGALRALVEEAGLGYVHRPDLGPPVELLRAYRADGDWTSFREVYLAYVNGVLDCGDVLPLLAAAASPCLMCFEADASRCHRSLLAQALTSRHPGGLEVKTL